MVAAIAAIVSLILGMTAVPTARASDLYPFHAKVWVTGPAGDTAFNPPSSIDFKFKCEAGSSDGSVLADADSIITVPRASFGNENTGAEPTPHPTTATFALGTKCTLIGVDGNSADVPGYTYTVKPAVDGYGVGFARPLHDQAQGKFPVKLVYEKAPEPYRVPLYVTKKIVAPTEGFTAPASIDFRFQCTQDSLDGAVKANEPATGTIRSADFGSPVKINDFPEGTQCMILEEDKESAQVAGYELAVTGNFNEFKTLHNQEGYNKKFWIENTYTKSASSFKVAKKLGDNAPAEAATKKYEFAAKCTKDGETVFEKTITVTGASESELYEVPVGAECTVTEDKAKAEVTGYNLDVTVKNDTFTATTESTTVEFTNTYAQKLGKVSLTKVVSGLAAGSSLGSSATEVRDFTVEASWKDASGTTVTKTLVISEGVHTELPALPVGTVVTLKEILPANSGISTWGTPRFAADVEGVIRDNGDGTAVLTVPADAEAKAVVVTVTNSKDLPWWLILIPLIPLAIIPFLPKPQPPAPQVETPPAAPTKGVAKGVAAKQVSAPLAQPAPAAQAAPQQQLAQTGASVIGLALFASLIVIAGVVLIRRARKN